MAAGIITPAIDYLQKIINDKNNLRYDLQCYARLVHLMAHYELGNDMLMESLTKSVYRFMAKMKNLTVVEEAMFKFLRQSISLSRKQLKPELEKFLQTIKHLEKNRFQTSAFAYLDIISWVESKVYDKPMGTIIHEKYLKKINEGFKHLYRKIIRYPTFLLFFRMKKYFFFLLLYNFQTSAQIKPENITIARDSFGVPHIFAPTDPEVAYGLAWAHAEDDFETLQLVVLSGKAKLGKSIG